MVRQVFAKSINSTDNIQVDSSEGDEPANANATRQSSVVSKNVPRPKNVPSWLDESALAGTSKSTSAGSEHVGMGYVMYMPENDDTLGPGDLAEPNIIPHGTQDILSLQLPDALEQDQDDLFNFLDPGAHTFQIPQNNPRPPMTYSFQESTFARRLHRACAEAAYQLLLDPRRRPSEYQRIFRLSLLGRDRQKITTQLKAILARGPHEDLDFWEASSVHVGGAGTHYPRRDPYGNLLPKKKTFNVGKIGPQTLATLERSGKATMTMDMIVELAGFEGEWFDPYDVQGYLEEKGIFIDPASSFAEAQIVEWPKPLSDASTGSSESPVATPSAQFAVPGKSTPLTTSQVNIMINEDVDFSKWDDSRNLELTNVGYSDAEYGSWMNFLQPGESTRHYNENQAAWEDFNPDAIRALSAASSHTASPQPTRKSVLIDVSKLVKGMSCPT